MSVFSSLAKSRSGRGAVQRASFFLFILGAGCGLEGIFARAGCRIPRQRLCDWIAHGVFFFEAIVMAMWEELCRYTDDGIFKMDNNDIERQMIPIAIGRRNWFFAGSHEGAHRAAVLFSLINSCSLLGIKPYEYIADVLVQRVRGVKAAEITPLKWKLARG